MEAAAGGSGGRSAKYWVVGRRCGVFDFCWYGAEEEEEEEEAAEWEEEADDLMTGWTSVNWE